MKISKRIKTAIKAFKEGPAPTLFLGAPPYLKEQQRILSIGARAHLHGSYYLPDYSTMAEEDAKRDIARRIGLELLENGCIQFTYFEHEAALMGKIRVFAPKEEDTNT